MASCGNSTSSLARSLPDVPPERIRVLVLAAYPAVRAGLRSLLDGAPGIEVVGDLPLDGLAAAAPSADVLVLDLDERAASDLLAEAFPGMPAVLLAASGDEPGEMAGPHAVLHRDATASELAAAVVAVSAGLVVYDPALAPLPARPLSLLDPGDGSEPLTERELDVLRQLALGLPNKTIALNLGISEHTVKFHVSSVLAKLNAASRTEAVMLAARRGLLPL